MSAARATPAPLLRARRVLLPLLLLAAAGAGATDDDCGQERRVTIAASKKISTYGVIRVSYKEELTFFCSSTDASNLTMRLSNNGHQLYVEHLNSTTIQVRHAELDGEYEYICMDGNTGCSDSLKVYVQPAMSVTGPRVHYTVDKYDNYIYFTPQKDSFNLSCTGENAGFLKLYRGWYDHPINATTVNATTVNATTISATMADDTLRGTHTFNCISRNDGIGGVIKVIFDDYPGINEFRCILKWSIEHSKGNIECSWKTSRERNKFKLFLLDSKSAETALVCVDTSSAAGLVRGCGSDLDDEQMKYFANNVLRQYAWLRKSVYRVEYRLLGTDWRLVNASAVRCEREYVSGSYVNACELPVALPCPDAHYELRVSIRHVKTTGDLYWSDPAHVYFFTTASAGDEALDPACAAEYIQPPPPVTAESVFNEVQKLIDDIRKRKKPLKKRVSTLHQKKAKAIELMKKLT